MKPRPSYRTHDPKGYCGDPKRGAALGRPTIHDAPKDEPVRLYLKRRRWVDGDYDENGTYFGAGGGGHIYWYANREGTVDGVVRATSRREAKAEIRREYYPNATFLRWTVTHYVLILDNPPDGPGRSHRRVHDASGCRTGCGQVDQDPLGRRGADHDAPAHRLQRRDGR